MATVTEELFEEALKIICHPTDENRPSEPEIIQKLVQLRGFEALTLDMKTALKTYASIWPKIAPLEQKIAGLRDRITTLQLHIEAPEEPGDE